MKPSVLGTKWLKERIFITDLTSLGLDPTPIKKAASELPFIYGHVGGHGTNSPRRGVCVLGNELSDGTLLSKTNWTLTQNHSGCTLVSETKPMPKPLKDIIPSLLVPTKKYFPGTPISPSSYALFVANEYLPGSDHTIAAHTDDQPWYSSPAVFVSVTFFPDGIPESSEHTHRFQVYDESDQNWKDCYLPDKSVCFMRADVSHRVVPPLKKIKNTKRRINLTFRNLAPPEDSLGLQLAFANHYRYYGIPVEIRLAKDQERDEVLDSLIKKFGRVKGGKIRIVRLNLTKKEISEEKKNLRGELRKKYEKEGVVFNAKMASKTNVVLETLKAAL